MPKKPKDKARSDALATEIKRLVELRQGQHLKETGKELSIRQIEKELDLEHPALKRIIDGANDLMGERSRWSLFKLGRYLGSDFGEAWLSEYIGSSKAQKNRSRSKEATPLKDIPPEWQVASPQEVELIKLFRPQSTERRLEILQIVQELVDTTDYKAEAEKRKRKPA